MKRVWWVLMLAVVVSLGPLAAQEPSEPQDTAEAGEAACWGRGPVQVEGCARNNARDGDRKRP